MTNHENALINVTRQGDRYQLTPPPEGDMYSPKQFAHHIANLLISLSQEDHSPVGEVPGSDDFLENLEVEMANDVVSDEVGVQRDLQNMTAARLLDDVFLSGHADAAEDEVEALAFWLNRQTHTLRKSDLPEDARELLEFVCRVTNLSLLSETVPQ